MVVGVTTEVVRSFGYRRSVNRRLRLEAPEDSFLAVANSPVVEVAYNRVVSRPAVDRISLPDTVIVEVLTDDAIVALTTVESILSPATGTHVIGVAGAH